VLKRDVKHELTRLQNYTIGASLMSVSVSVSVPWGSSLKLDGTDTYTDTDILADFRARIVARMSACPAAFHEPDTHDEPRRLVRHAARFSSRGCPLGMRACTRVLFTISYRVYTSTKLHDRRIANVGVRVSAVECQLN